MLLPWYMLIYKDSTNFYANMTQQIKTATKVTVQIKKL